jgi:protein-S-isoprenylcysteine O-methyltransferase Ste14
VVQICLLTLLLLLHTLLLQLKQQDSFTRIALAAALLYVFDQKATKEEEALTVVHPAYKTYQEEVPKFFPLPGNLNLPWGDGKQ